MGILSNLLGSLPGKDSPRLPPEAFAVRPARKDELHACIQLILGSPASPAHDDQVVDFLRLAVHRQINLSDVWLAEHEGVLAWAALPLASPGRSMLTLWPDGLTPALAPAAQRVLEAAGAHFKTRDVRLAQTLLEPGDAASLEVHRSCGYGQIADLLYLQANISARARPAALQAGWSWKTYTPALHGLFAQTILATYENSLDCPALNGVRDIDDIMAGHRAAGEFDPAWWMLLCREDSTPVGVLLLSRTARNNAAELVYVGLTPAARGYDLGDLLLRHAMHELGAAGLRRICLAVDANNAPALKLYFRYGFARIGCKIAMMKHLNR